MIRHRSMHLLASIGAAIPFLAVGCARATPSTASSAARPALMTPADLVASPYPAPDHRLA